MSVNNMTFEQSADFLAQLHEQATGQATMAPVDSAGFVSVATSTLKAGTDAIINALSQVLTNTLIAVRPYERKFAGLEYSSDKWGAITRKINYVEDEPRADYSYQPEILEGGLTGVYPINLPKVIQTQYYGRDIYSHIQTIPSVQLNAAFKDATSFGTFITGLLTHLSNMREQWLEDMTRGAVLNFIGAKILADRAEPNGQVIHVATEYNTLTGLNLNKQQLMQPQNFTPFIRWLYGRLNTLARKMGERSELFQQKLTAGHIIRHTPARDLRAYILADFKDQIDAQTLSTTYNDNYLTMVDTEGVSFWQGLDVPERIMVKPSYIGADGAVVESENNVIGDVLGVFFDRDAIGYNLYNDTVQASPYDAYRQVYSLVAHTEIQLQNDITEKGVVIMLD